MAQARHHGQPRAPDLAGDGAGHGRRAAGVALACHHQAGRGYGRMRAHQLRHPAGQQPAEGGMFAGVVGEHLPAHRRDRVAAIAQERRGEPTRQGGLDGRRGAAGLGAHGALAHQGLLLGGALVGRIEDRQGENPAGMVHGEAPVDHAAQGKPHQRGGRNRQFVEQAAQLLRQQRQVRLPAAGAALPVAPEVVGEHAKARRQTRRHVAPDPARQPQPVDQRRHRRAVPAAQLVGAAGGVEAGRAVGKAARIRRRPAGHARQSAPGSASAAPWAAPGRRSRRTHRRRGPDMP